MSCIQAVKEKESFLFTQSKIGGILLERFYFAVKGSILSNSTERLLLTFITVGFVAIGVISSEPVNRAWSLVCFNVGRCFKPGV